MAKRILILIAFILVVFSPCLQAEFINLDDDGHILENTAIRELSPSSIKQIFTQTINMTYIPLSTLSFAIEKHFFGFNPFIFHLDNLLIYIIDVILVLLLAKRMGFSLEASFWAALIFAIHPMRAESVAWVTEHKDVLYALFYLLALHQYWSYIKTLSMRYYLSTFLLGFLSILAKPMALSLPLILLLFDWFYGRTLNKRVLIEKVPIFVYVISITWITYALNMRHFLDATSPHGILIWTWSLAFYIWKFFYPFQVFPYYVLPHPIGLLHWPYFLSIVLCLGLALLLVYFRKHKLFVFAFLYFFCSIFFLLRFEGTYFNVVSDRFMFLPSMGICFFIGSWLDRRIKSRGGMIIFYLFLVLMGVRTNLECQLWHDSISFWDAIIKVHPNYRAFTNRGTAYFQKEHDDLALSDFNSAIVLGPKVALKAYNNRGFIYYLRFQDAKAFDDYNKAISLDPSYPVTYMSRSLLEKAEKHYPQALQDALHAKKLGLFVDDAYIQNLQQFIR